jgi:hypothetical protein
MADGGGAAASHGGNGGGGGGGEMWLWPRSTASVGAAAAREGAVACPVTLMASACGRGAGWVQRPARACAHVAAAGGITTCWTPGAAAGSF